MLIRNDKFSGEFPQRTTRRRGTNVAELALDCDIVSDSLRSIYESTKVGDAQIAGARTLFLMDGEFYTWAGDIDVVRTPVDNAIDRIFFTGEGAPKQATPQDYASGVSYRLGIPAPIRPIVVMNINGTGDPGRVEQDSVYVYRYVNKWGQRGPISFPTEFRYTPGQQIQLIGGRGDNTDLDDYAIVSWELYRLINDETQLVDIIPIDDDLYVDDTRAVLRETLVSINSYPPPITGVGLHVMSNGVGLMFVPGTGRVIVSEPYNLNAWPYEFSVSSDVVALSSYSNTAVVMTTGYPEIATIVNPQNIVPVKLNDREPCLSKRGVVQGADGVFYPGSSSLIYISAGGLTSVSTGYLDRHDWESLAPETFNAVYRDGCYMAFHGDRETGSTWIWDTREQNAMIRRLSMWGSSATAGEGNNDLFYVNDDAIMQYDSGTRRISKRWVSSEHGQGSPYAITTRRILSEDLRKNPQPAELEALRAIEEAATDARIIELDSRDGLSWAIGYGGAVGQTTLGDVMTEIAGLGVVRLPDPLELYYVDLEVYGDDELVHTERVYNEDEDRINYADRYRRWSYSLSGTADVDQIDLASSASEMHTGS